MSDLQAKIAELAARFAARAPLERAAIAGALAANDRELVIERAHKLAGIAGMFGHPDIGDAALALEEAARDGGDCGPPGERLLGILDGL